MDDQTALPSLYVLGDSTAANNKNPVIQGWGTPFLDYFDPTKINVVNAARGGRSSRTFITEGLLDAFVAKLKPGDTVLVQFGHNDVFPLNDQIARGSLHGIGEETEDIDNQVTGKHEVVHTYGWYLRKFINDIRAKGANPIILTLTIRDRWNKDGTIERLPAPNLDLNNTNRFTAPSIYSIWAAEVAKAMNVPVIDIHNMIADRYDKEGTNIVSTYFNSPRDPTHRNPLGAVVDAEITLAGLKAFKGPSFDVYLSEKGKAVLAADVKYIFPNSPTPIAQDAPTSMNTATLHPALFLIGDSIVKTGTGNGERGPWGWGYEIIPMFDAAKIHVYNEGLGGRSSRSYIEEGAWAKILPRIERGDFVMLHFGHNDAKNSENYPDRTTVPGNGDEAQEIESPVTHQKEMIHSYGWYLRQYVRDVQAKGATAIVCSSVPRDTWIDGKIKRGFDGYAQWAADAAKMSGAFFIDANTLAANRYDALGQVQTAKCFADNQHTTKAGARVNAESVVEGLKQLKNCPLANDLAPTIP
ncbi:MAG TPA: rhamnogalacturonan acetylesterase [Verrucomicrobiae bacterium]|nr:rhamnogalacturonan acetylesterase [Verrucomicrobiae bacterium]